MTRCALAALALLALGLTGCASQPLPTARVLDGVGATSCEIYAGASATYGSRRTCTARELEVQRALPVEQRSS